MTRKYRLERTAFIGCRNTAEIDGPQRKSIIEGEDEYNACIAALKTWNTRYSEKGKELNHGH